MEQEHNFIKNDENYEYANERSASNGIMLTIILFIAVIIAGICLWIYNSNNTPQNSNYSNINTNFSTNTVEAPHISSISIAESGNTWPWGPGSSGPSPAVSDPNKRNRAPPLPHNPHPPKTKAAPSAPWSASDFPVSPVQTGPPRTVSSTPPTASNERRRKPYWKNKYSHPSFPT